MADAAVTVAAAAPAVTAPLDGLLGHQAAVRPDAPALVAPGARLTFAALDTLAGRFAAALADALARAGAPATGNAVAVASELGPEFAVAYYGVLRSGNVVVPLIPLLPPPGLAHVLGTSGARLAVLPPALEAKAATVRAELPDLAAVLPLALPSPATAGTPAGRAEPEPAGPGAGGLDLPACIHFTSGTTGAPKAAVLSHRNLVTNALQTAAAHELDAEAITANHLPTFHPMHLNSALVAGATQVLCPGADVGEAVREAGRHGATHFYSLPVRLARLAAHDDLPSLRSPALRAVLSGGSPLAPALASLLGEGLGVPVVQGYGLAETSPLTHSDPPRSPRPGSVGPPVAGTECRLIDVETAEAVPAGVPNAIGEVQVRGPQVMLGYLGAEAPAVDEDGWFATGDVGRIDADGRLFLVDRIKDVFKHDNWLVSPTAIERALLDRPEVADCCVLDRPDPLHGGTAHALLVPAPGVPEPALGPAVEAVNAEAPYYERVASFEATLVVPRSPQGKVPRAELRRRLAAGRPAASPLPDQSREGGQSMATMVNKFTVFGDPDEFEKVWLSSADFMKKQQGFVGFRLMRSVMDPLVYINVAEWATVEDHQRVLQGPDFQTHIKELAALATPEPNLCTLVAEATATQG